MIEENRNQGKEHYRKLINNGFGQEYEWRH